MKIVRHRLHHDDGRPLPFRASPNQSAGLQPEYVVMHYTAGSSAESSIAWLTNPAARASAHVVVARDGCATQLVPFNRCAWHAGSSQWGNRTGLNQWMRVADVDPVARLFRDVLQNRSTRGSKRECSFTAVPKANISTPAVPLPSPVALARREVSRRTFTTA